LRNLKIAILSYRSAQFGGGQGVYVKDISYALSLMGYSVDVISGPPYPNLHHGINLIKLPGLDLFETFNFNDRCKKFFKKKNKSRFDFYEFISVLLGGFPEPKTFGIRANQYLRSNNDYDLIIDNQSLSHGMLEIQKRTPFIEIIHHPITIDYKYELQSSTKIKYKISRHRWYSFLKMQKKVAPNIKRIITPSISSRDGIIDEFKCNKENISVINNGLDTNEFAPIENFSRNKYRLITTASADVPLKGLDYTLKALKILKNEFPKIHLIIIGKIKKNGHTERFIKKLNLEENVIFKSNLSKLEIKELYASSSIAIVSSLYEGFGYPVIEAMSCEIPLIATNVSAIPELTSNYAKLIEPKNSQMISNSVIEIFSNYPKYIEIAKKGRQHVIQNFNWIKITEEYEKVISKTIEEFNNANF
jgi:glycosyltransferase involved in cell wall biosynthesis